MSRLRSGKAFFWKGVFSIGFFIRNESPSSQDMCATFRASVCFDEICTVVSLNTRRATLQHTLRCRWLH
jgi:hypothetical protein